MTNTALKDTGLVSRISDMIRYALISEVSATPKPGLVDLHDNGAHTDMCYDTFAVSTEAITPYLVQMFETGLNWPVQDGDGLFAAIRPIGIEAEKAMFQATRDVNTHKGMIFSMGITAAAAGLYYQTNRRFRADPILLLSGRLCRDSLEKDFQKIDREHPRTHGEILYVRSGLKGIRGEAQEGFPSIRNISLPAMNRWKITCIDDNQVYLNTLLALMSQVDDTNVLTRTSSRSLACMKACALQALELGGAATAQGMAALERMNREFIRLNISPGGCADLLAVTILLWRLEHYKEEEN